MRSYGTLSAVRLIDTPTSFSAFDTFVQSTGNLTGKTAPIGGVWAGAGDADDMVLDGVDTSAKREALSDADFYGRGVTLPVSMTGMVVQVDTVALPALNGSGNSYHVVQARWVDESNLLVARYRIDGLGNYDITVLKKVSGTETTLAGPTTAITQPPQVWRTLGLRVESNGVWSCFDGPQGGPLTTVFSGWDSVLATGGALASGRPGFRDARTIATFTRTRYYDNFVAYPSTPDAAIFGSQSLELRHDKAIREDSTGSFWNSVTSHRGNHLLIPPAGREARASRMMVKATRTPVVDSGVDDIRATLSVTPRYLSVPEG